MTKSYNDPFHHCDYNAIIDGTKNNGVKTGLAVSERGAGQNMSVDVASGTALINKLSYTESSTVNLSISASHATLPRRDIVIYDVATTNPKIITGTAATEPIPPNITSGDILLSVVNVAASVTVITNSDIEDGRISVTTHANTHHNGGCDALEFYDINSTSVLDNNSSERVLTNVLTKEKENVLGDTPDTIKIKFTLSVYTSGPSLPASSSGRIYRNGSPVGTQRSKSNGSIGGYWEESWTESISGWSNGDLLQLYCYKSGTSEAQATCKVFDLQIIGTNIIIYSPVSGITHQDP